MKIMRFLPDVVPCCVADVRKQLPIDQACPKTFDVLHFDFLDSLPQIDQSSSLFANEELCA